MNNVQIPLNAHINTRDEFIIHNIESQEKDALNKKNTLVFQSTLSPLYTKAENKVFTTTGHTLTVANNQITDEKGNTFEVDNSFTIENVVDISTLSVGKCTSALIDDDKVYSTWENGNQVKYIISDFDNNIIQEFSENGSYLYTRIKLFNNKNYVVAFINNDIIRMRFYDSTNNLFGSYFTSASVGSDLYTYYNDATEEYYIGFDDVDLRKRYLYKFAIVGSTMTYQWAKRGFGCISSEGIVTGEPIPCWCPDYTVDEITPSSSYSFTPFLDFAEARYSVLENGVIAVDTAYYNTISVQDWITSNQELKQESTYTDTSLAAGSWGHIDHTLNARWRIIGGFDLKTTSFYPFILDSKIDSDPNNIIRDISNGYYLELIGIGTDSTARYQQVDLQDGWGNLEWSSGLEATIENGCNPFPYRYFICNRAESKGIYWDYGTGWCKSYYRSGELRRSNEKKCFVQKYPTAILLYDGHSIRREYLSPRLSPSNYEEIVYSDIENPSTDQWSKISSETAWRYHLFAPSMFDNGMIWTEMIGADNLPNHSVLNRIPFNVQRTEYIYDNYFQDNYMSTSFDGTLLTSASVQNDTPSYITGNSIFSNSLVFEITQNGDVKVAKIADYIYKSNTIKGNNLFIDASNGINAQRGFIAYNGEEVITSNEFGKFKMGLDNENTDGNDTYYSAAGYNVSMTNMTERGVSYLLPAFQLPLIVNSEEVEDFTFQMISNKKELTKPLIYKQITYKDGPIDHYYNHSLNSTNVQYQVSKKAESNPDTTDKRLFGVKTYDVDKANFTWWLTDSIQIFPLGLVSKLTGINYLASNIDFTDDYSVRLYRTQNVTFPAYNPETEVYKSNNIFTIYGNNYSFDGQSIYYLGSGDTTDQSSFACYALGMKFLANSGTEAYFYSPFEKRLYLFTGSVTLQIADSLAREGNIVDSVYSSCEQILYILTDEGKLLMKSQEDMCAIDGNFSGYHLESTETGAVLVSDNGYKKYRLYQTDETEWLPIEYETEYIGKNDNLFKIAAVELTCFKGDGDTVNGNFTFECMNDKLKYNETIPFTVSKKDWDESQLVKVKVSPKNNVCKAFRFGISSDDYLHIANVNVVIDEVSQNTNAQKRR